MKKALALLFCWLAVSALLAHGQVQLFLEVETPTVGGESKVVGYEGDIVTKSYSHLITNTPTTGGGGNAGTSVHGDVALLKLLDKASPVLLLRLNQGALFGKMRVLFARNVLGTLQTFYQVELTNVIITSVAQKAPESGENLREELTLTYDKIKWTYWPEKADGSLDTPISHEWNRKTHSGT